MNSLEEKNYRIMIRNYLIKTFIQVLLSLRSLELIRVYGKDYHNDKTRLVESEVKYFR